MRRQLTLLALCLCLSLGALPAPSADPEQAALLERAQLWQSRNRDDLAREALDRLFRIAPDHPEGLLLLARLQIRANQNAEAAKTFERLRAAHPNHPAVAQLAATLRIQGADKDRLRQARQLARVGRTDEALKAYRALFPDAFPDDDLELEYAELLAATPGGRDPARVLLTKLAAKHPEDPRYRLALARYESARKPVSPDTLKTLRELSADPTVSKQARDAWRRALLAMDAVEESLPALREYVADDPGDTAVKERLDSVSQVVGQQRRQLADPGFRAKHEGLALLEAGRLDEAEPHLREAITRHPDDPEAVGGMSLLRLRQGRHAEALDHLLTARRLDASNAAKWDALIRTARYWSLLKEAGRARETGNPELAERKLQEARGVDPREPNGAIELGRLYAAQSRGADAERLYREALALAPGNAYALESLIALYLRAGRDGDAEALVGELTPAQRREIGDSVNVLVAARLRERAKLLQSQARTGEAIALLEKAAVLDPLDPWLRFDLARLYAARGEAERGRALFDGPLQLRRNDPDTLYALALFLSGVDLESEALATLERVGEAGRTPGMARLQRRLWVSVQGQRAAALAGSGQRGEAGKVLAAAGDAIGNDGELGLDVAGAYVRIGDAGAARSLLDRFAATVPPPSLDWRIGQARILDRIGADRELRALLDQIAALGPTTPEQGEAIADLRLSLSLRQADALIAAGEPAKGLQVLRDAKPAKLPPAREMRHQYAEASALRALGRWDEAAAIYRAILQANPGERDAELALVETLIASGQRGEASQFAGELLRAPRKVDPDYSVSLAGYLMELKDFAGARSQVEAALLASPDHPRALAYAGQLALREGRIDRAIDFQQRSQAAGMRRASAGVADGLSLIAQPAVAGDPPSIVAAQPDAVAAQRSAGGGHRQLAELLDQEAAWFSSALDWRGRAGTSGKSQLGSQELPLEWRAGWSDGSRWFFRADAARVTSGTLDLADATEAATFGSVLLCQPQCGTGALRQEEKGLALGVGLEWNGFRLDAGTSPIGFPVVNVLGGILYKGDAGPASYSLDVSRRPVTSSLLSHSGTTDPNTGRTWGGVVATGVRLGLSRDSGGDYGAWSSLGLHRLSGRNVQDNDRAQLMAGAYRRVINEEDRQLAVGLTGMLWRFSENAGEFTFGHGGYYSPRSYGSLALPVTYGVRTARSSFAVRASVSVAWAKTDRAPYFPTDPDMQSQAEALTPVNGIDPYYAGGNDGRSYGRALGAAWEHQLLPSVFFGGRIELERSTNYTPNRFLLYVRIATDRVSARPVALPPEPVLPSSQY